MAVYIKADVGRSTQLK